MVQRQIPVVHYQQNQNAHGGTQYFNMDFAKTLSFTCFVSREIYRNIV